MQSQVYSYCKLLTYVFRIYIWSSNLFRIFLLHQVSINFHKSSSLLYERWIRFSKIQTYFIITIPFNMRNKFITYKRILNEITISLRKIYKLHFVVGKIMYLSLAMSSAKCKTHLFITCLIANYIRFLF